MVDISKHAKERYAQRIKNKDDHSDMAVFIANHEKDITDNINKMVKYGKKIYSGRSIKDPKVITDIFVKDTWVVIVDKNKKLVVTLFKVDLKVDEEFTKEYIEKVLAKLDEAQEKYNKAQEDVLEKIEEYQELMKENTRVINEYRATVKSLEKQNELYKGLIQEVNSTLKVSENELLDCVTILTGNKSW